MKLIVIVCLLTLLLWSRDAWAQELPPPPQESMLTTTPELQIDHANHYYSREDFKQALPEYLKFLELFPNHPRVVEVQYRLGECYRELQNPQKAEEQFVLVIKKYPSTEFEKRSVYRLGEMRYVDGRYPEAIEILSPLLRQRTSAAVRNGAAYYVAKSQAEQGKWAEAESALAPIAAGQDLRELGPFVLELMGRIQRALGKTEKALDSWRAALDLKAPESVETDLWANIGAGELELGNAKEALQAFSKLNTSKLPERYVPVVTVGYLRAAYQAGEYKRITDSATTLYDRLPAAYRAEAGYLIGSANRKQFYWEPAVQWLEKNLKDHPDSAYAENASYDVLLCYGALNREKQLQTAAKQFLKSFPNSAMAVPVRFMLAESFFKEKSYKEAVPYYEFVSKHGEGEEMKADAAYKKAWCLQMTGEKSKSKNDFLAFADAYPRHANADDAVYLAASLATELKEWKSAVEAFNRLFKTHPDHPFNTAHFEMAMVQAQVKDVEGMEKNLQTFLKKNPKHSRVGEANYWLGWLETQRRDWKAALKYLDQAAGDPDASYHDEVRLRRAIVYYYLKKLEEAHREIDYFASRGRLKEVPLEVIRWTAQRRLETFQHSEAITAYRWYLEMANTKEQLTDAQMGLARSHAGKGNWADAIESYKKVIASEGLNELGIEARLGAVRAIIEKGGDLDPAQRLLFEVQEARPEGIFNARARMLQGDVYVVQKKDKEAGKEYYRVGLLFDDPDLVPWALKMAADSFERAGDMAEAKRIRDELAQRYPKAAAEKAGKPKPNS